MTPNRLSPDHLHLDKTERLTDPSMTAGDRLYVIGAQDGSFPDMGSHVEGEMGGVWAHPIKLLDGFWLGVGGTWLTNAHRFTSGPFWTMHAYLGPAGLAVSRLQFVPDGEPALVVRYTFRSRSERVLRLRFLARCDLQPVWDPNRNSARHGGDEAVFLAHIDAWLCSHSANPWFVAVGAREHRSVGHDSGRDLWGPEMCQGEGISVGLEYAFALDANQKGQIEFIIAGSSGGRDEALSSLERVRRTAPTLWASKAQRYEEMLHRSTIEIPDAPIVRAWDWVKCDYDWLIRDVPGVGRGLGAGVPEYPWWFGCDNSYSLLGCLALGQHEVATETLDLIRDLSVRANGISGRVIHECTTAGQVTHRGNTQETPHFVATVWQTFRWTGDLAFLRRNYDVCRRGLLEWTLGEQSPDGDLLPYGYGIVEIPGLDLQCVDTATYTVAALFALAGMAEAVGDEDVRARCLQLGATARARLQEMFWIEAEGLYGDMLATPVEMIPRLENALSHLRVSKPQSPAIAGLRRLLREAKSEQEQHRTRVWLCRNWMLICPLEVGLASREQARRMLCRIEGPEFTDRRGMYLSGLDRREVMSINTGVAAAAEMVYGRVEAALRFIDAIAETVTSRMPGAISEISPAEGCFVQAWSGYGIAWPVVTQLFGVQPDAFRRHLRVTPKFPAGWPRASLKGVRIGNASFDILWSAGVLSVECSEDNWTVTCPDASIRLAYQGLPVHNL